MGSIAFRPLLIAQDAKGDDSKLKGACQLYGTLNHTGVGRKICGVEIKQVHAARARGPQLLFSTVHSVGATSSEHDVLTGSHPPSYFAADITATAKY